MAIHLNNPRLRHSVFAISAVSACLANGAIAQSNSSSAQLEEILVQAQRREERLQDVPIAIAALGSEELAARAIVDIGDLRSAVPSLSVSHSAGINASNLIAMRGVSGLPSPIGTSQATAVYLDGVYLTRPNAAFFSLDDVERVEVLRGPQGTLYGRNATAGAISIVTRTPGETVKGGFDVSAGSHGAHVARGSISGPLVGGLAGGISGSYDEHDGYFDNRVTGNEIGDRESHTVRGKLRYANESESFTADLSADYSKIETQTVFQNTYTSFAPTGVLAPPHDADTVSIDAASEDLTQSLTRSKGMALVINVLATDDLEFTSISAYREIKASDYYDLDGSAVPGIFSLAKNSSEAYSQELRAVLTTDRFFITGGLNYFTEDATYELAPFGSPVVAPTIPLTSPDDKSDLEAYAAFTQVEFEVVPDVTLVGGLRFNHEERDFTVDYTQSTVPGPKPLIRGSVSDNAVIPSAGVNWQISPDLLVYGKVSEGYQAPGFNGQPGTASTDPNTFDAEQLVAYELGLKSQFLDRRLTFNAAAFYYDYSDLQVRSTVQPGQTRVDNAATATIQGAEITLIGAITDTLTLSTNMTYLDSEYGDFCEQVSGGAPFAGDPSCANPLFADRSGNRMNLAPEFSGSVSLTYRTSLSDVGEFSANVSYGWESNAYFQSNNESLLATGGWERVDSRVALALNNGIEVYVYGKNLTDDRYYGFALRGSPTLVPVTWSDPRTFGAGLRFQY
jgi:iron complex outermembrane receptor protein